MKLILPIKPTYPADFQITFTTKTGLELVNGYNRVVIGQRGPYIEFDEVITKNIHIPDNMMWKLFSPVVFYIEYRSNDDCNVKIYHQKRTVRYADYIVDKWYISPFEITSNVYKILAQD